MKLTKETRNLILAMAIGDGNINNGCLFIVHCEKQKQYLDWKHELIKNISGKISRFINNGYVAYRFNTKRLTFLKQIKPYLYKQEKITPKILNRIGVIGLAIWYMDDGSLIKKKRNGKIHAYELVLSTYFNSEEKANEIIDWFKTKLNINFTVKRNKGKFSIRCGTSESRKFIQLIKPYVEKVGCFDYKIDINLESG
ncbi:hypothetical protein [Geminocystis sp. GBBB08]|uniref:hypothetical protein n=1 Tax=Geminocystis sp. GBBB08 TaxID=2604140 RepID=UPI0027E26938|nr:hypothetical protein [Geminocystis sp. GBBB08]MBL1208752.1 hypothetical protein [Geminocystis sp. GBBB08]